MFGHVRNPDYVAPEGDAWRHPESNSETENLDDYVAYQAGSDSDEPQVAPPPVAPRRRRPAPPKPKKTPEAEAGSSTQREGKQVIQEGVVEDDDSSTESDNVPPTIPEATEYDSETGRKKNYMPGGRIQLEKAKKKPVEDRDEDFIPEVTTKEKHVSKKRVKRSALKTKEPRSKKSKTSGFKLVDEPESVPADQSTPMPNIFEQGASGLEGIDINVDDLISTPPSQHRQKSTPEASSQRTPQPEFSEVVLC